MGINKNNSESLEKYHKIFIEQTPTAIAMLDNNMVYLAISQRWLKDYKLEEQEVIGRSHYDVFPEIGDDWKEHHKKCLQGAVDTCDEAPFQRADGSLQWIYWDVRPWYTTNGEVGGLLMHTGDITHQKEKDLEKKRIEEILEKTNEIARIGTWDLNLITNEVYWSEMVREIHEVSEDFIPTMEASKNFYEETESRDRFVNTVRDSMLKGTPFDLELEIITAKGKSNWVRVVGQPEILEGKCTRLFGIIQDINKIIQSEKALSKAHSELQGIFNSKAIAIITADKNGFINRFNQGAEEILGYSATELVGSKRPDVFLVKEEIAEFRKNLVQSFNKDPSLIDPVEYLKSHDLNNTREWTYRRKNGDTFPVLTTLSSLKNDKGENEGFIAVATDISKLKKVENELLKKNQLLNFAEELSMIGHWQWNTVLDKVEWSQNLYTLVELDEEFVDLKFDTYFSFVHPEDKEIVTHYFDKAVKNKEFYSFTHRIVTTSGKTKTIQLLGEVITNKKGEVIEMIGTGQDVTEIKMAERKFRGLLESAPDAMVIVNEKGKIQLINKQSEKLFGYTPEELFEKSVEVLIPEKLYPSHTSHRKNFSHTPKAREMGSGKELYGVNKIGKKIPIQISLSPLHTEEGLLVSAAIRDITKQKLAESKLIEAKENLEHIAQKLSKQNKQLADFTHITSHNLRAPVANLNSLMELYNMSESEPERIDLLDKFETVIQHLTLTLNTLIEALKTKITDTSEGLENVDLNDVLKSTNEILSGVILKSGAIVKGDFSNVSTITYNKVYMESIFLNLVGNAIKYKSEARAPEIFITSEVENGKIILKFKDNGLGIDLERHRHKLFGLNKVFHRHHDAKGVGLFLTKTQIEVMGGFISASSKVDVGTTFTINFN
ncbi:PAS domain-containing sensor histidine kinase [Maribacter arcticus]|uniref:histidine kinase n=1 Tax=Maribacter arcticus TaxID=561365 RepID=A0A1T5D519_9FLAO|nr:PAS domain S-box protein [Maribacter arcticus]SKB66769.1 PAS domain S-box-containing protein [Maribacter arcticus]